MIVAIDVLSQYVVAEPVANITTETTIEFVQNIVLRFGAMRAILSDNGSNFKSAAFEEYLEGENIRHLTTSAYHPCANGLVENMNKFICRTLAIFAHSNEQEWDKLLPSIVSAINSSRNSATGMSPYFCVYGKEMRTGLENQLELEDVQELAKHDFVQNKNRLEMVRNIAKMRRDKSRLDSTLELKMDIIKMKISEDEAILKRKQDQRTNLEWQRFKNYPFGQFLLKAEQVVWFCQNHTSDYAKIRCESCTFPMVIYVKTGLEKWCLDCSQRDEVVGHLEHWQLPFETILNVPFHCCGPQVFNFAELSRHIRFDCPYYGRVEEPFFRSLSSLNLDIDNLYLRIQDLKDELADLKRRMTVSSVMKKNEEADNVLNQG
ncbi:Pro-Pol polyprotein [Halotydeus destructor]|nr:Pro-Pol polyprotein [Halotydeus destructor]